MRYLRIGNVLLFLLFFVLAVISCAKSATAPTPNSNLTSEPSPTRTPIVTSATDSLSDNVYSNTVYKWPIRYPADWIVDSSNPASVKIQPGVSGVALVSIHSGAVRFTVLDDFVDYTLAYNEADFKQKGQTLVVITRKSLPLPNGISAIDVIKEIRPGGKTHDVFALVGNQGFIITAETYIEKWDTFSSDFDRILESFTIFLK